MFVPRLTGLAALCFVALMVGPVTITWAMIGGGALVALTITLGVVPQWSLGAGATARAAWSRRCATDR